MFKTLKSFMRATLAAGLMAGATAGASFAGQYVGGDLNLNLDESDDVLVIAADVVLTGRVGGDLTGFAADVSVNADIEGDIQLVAADIEIDGTVQGSVELAGADLRIAADLFGGLEAAGADVVISGTVSGKSSIAGASVTVTPGGILNGPAEIAARNLYIEGRMASSAEIHAREVVISGLIEGPVDIRARDVVIESDARIIGPITVRAPKAPVVTPGAEMGELEYIEQAYDDDGGFDGPNVHIGLDDFDIMPSIGAIGGVFAASAFLLGAMVALIAPRGVSAVARAFRKRPWVSGFLGVVVLAVLPVLVITLVGLLAVTVIGIPLAVLLIFALPIVLFLAFAFGGVVLGDLVLNRTGEAAGMGLRLGSFLAAMLVIGVLSVVPVLGFIIGPIVLCIGLGAWTQAIFSRPSATAPATEGGAV